MNDFYCVLERYYKNPMIKPKIELYQAKYVKAPYEIHQKYKDYEEHIFVYKTHEEAKKHYNTTKVCVDLGYMGEDEEANKWTI